MGKGSRRIREVRKPLEKYSQESNQTGKKERIREGGNQDRERKEGY